MTAVPLPVQASPAGPELLAGPVVDSWAVPVWATCSRPDEAAVFHELEATVGVVTTGGHPVRVVLAQTDSLAVEDGRVVVRRDGPEVAVDILGLSLAQAARLVEALTEVIAGAGGAA